MSFDTTFRWAVICSLASLGFFGGAGGLAAAALTPLSRARLRPQSVGTTSIVCPLASST